MAGTYQGPYINPWSPSSPTTPINNLQYTSNHPSNGGILTVFVNSVEEVNNYPVAAGLTVLLVSFNLNRFWLKGTDTSGIPRPIRTFVFSETTPPQPEGSDTVTRAEFTELRETLNKLVSELGGK